MTRAIAKRMLSPALLLALAACTTQPGDALHAQQEAACATVIATHINRPMSEVSARWLSTDPQGNSRVVTRDGGRRHVCEVDPNGRVRAYWDQPI